MLLLFLVLVPFIFGLLCWISEYVNIWYPRYFSLFSMIIVLGISVFLWISIQYKFDEYITGLHFPYWQLEYIYPWIPRFGINFHLALDGLSVLMVVLSSFLGLIAVLCSWSSIKNYSGYFYFNLLWMMGGIIGAFLAIDLFLFFFFWEITLIPMFFLISLWGHKELCEEKRFGSAIKFVIYTQLSGLFILVSIIFLASFHHNLYGIWSFEYHDLLSCCILLSEEVKYFVMLGFFLAFVIKIPIVPFHSWLPDTHSCTPVFGAIDIVGILLKTAVYGLLRFSVPFFPEASKLFAPVAISLGILSIFYGAFIAFMQTNIKRLVSYISISHMGFIILGIYSANQLAYQGVVIHMITHSLSIAGLFILCGQLYSRLHTWNIQLIGGGLWNHIDFIPAFSLCFIASILGLPGTGNFIGEILIFLGSFQSVPVMTIIAIFGIIFSSIYSLFFMQRVYYGRSLLLNNKKLLKNVIFREKFIIVILLICIFFIGIFPKVIMDTSESMIQNLLIWCKKI